MKRISFIFCLAMTLATCYKWSPNWRDTKFRNKFVGKWRIDSIQYFLPSIHEVGDTVLILDTQYTVYAKPDDYLEILFTKDQVEKNVTCTGKFMDSTFSYDVQGYDDKNAQSLGFTYCLTCSPSITFQKYIMGSRWIKMHERVKLKMGTKFWLNDNDDKIYYKDTYLTKIE
jgi:hypothetical protein